MTTTFVIHDKASQDRATSFVAALGLGTRWELTIDKFRTARSLQQNRLYWKWMGIIAKETGHTQTEVHEWMRRQFLPPSLVEINGVVHEALPSTTKLTVGEMSDYMTMVDQLAASMNIRLPHPDEWSK